MKTLATALVFAILPFTVSAKEERSFAGSYTLRGSPPWAIELREDNNFTINYSDSGGFHSIEGLWKEQKGKAYLLTEKEDGLEVFRIIRRDKNGVYFIDSPSYSVVDVTDKRVSLKTTPESIGIIKPSFPLHRDE